VPNPGYPVMSDLMKAGGFFHRHSGQGLAFHALLLTRAGISCSICRTGTTAHPKNVESYYISTNTDRVSKAGKPFCLNLNISDPTSRFGMRMANPRSTSPAASSRRRKCPSPDFSPDDPAVREELRLLFLGASRRRLSRRHPARAEGIRRGRPHGDPPSLRSRNAAAVREDSTVLSQHADTVDGPPGDQGGSGR
jgi:hypothetical protein